MSSALRLEKIYPRFVLIKIHDLDVAGLTVFGPFFFSLHDKFFSPSFFGSERWTYKSKGEKRIDSSNQIHDPLNS